MRTVRIRVCLRVAGGIALLLSGNARPVAAQDAERPLVFTVGVPDRAPSATTTLQISTSVDERGLAMWSTSTTDFGVAVSASRSRWTLRSIAGLTTLPVENHARPNLWQSEIVSNLYSTRTFSVAGGGGIREEWDGTRTVLGRVMAGSDFAGGRLQGSLVIGRTVFSPHGRRDAADLVTTLGWSRRVSDRFSLGVESIGQDLEGLWDPSEVDGGTRLVIGASLQVQSKHRTWTASLTAGPVLHQTGRPALESTNSFSPAGGHHFAIFASANWVPALRR